MAKITMNELKLEIAEIVSEAKKKKEKADAIKKRGSSVEAYGLYDEAFDFSSPLGVYNLYRQQGGVNYGPYTGAGISVDSTFNSPAQGALQMKESDERALRAMVREVIQNGLVPESSAWAPMLEKKTVSESPWHEAEGLFEAWYDRFKKSKKSEAESKKSKKESDYGPVKKHGFPPKKGKK